MKLYSHPVSPFARKARIIAHELGIKLEVVHIESARNDANLRQVNPLKQIPVLVLDDGSSLFDSPVICEYLNHTGGGKFFPGMNIFKHNSGRWKALVTTSCVSFTAAKTASGSAGQIFSAPSTSPILQPVVGSVLARTGNCSGCRFYSFGLESWRSLRRSLTRRLPLVVSREGSLA